MEIQKAVELLAKYSLVRSVIWQNLYSNILLEIHLVISSHGKTIIGLQSPKKFLCQLQIVW